MQQLINKKKYFKIYCRFFSSEHFSGNLKQFEIEIKTMSRKKHQCNKKMDNSLPGIVRSSSELEVRGETRPEI